MTSKTPASIQRLKIVELLNVWTFMFETAGRKVACENSRPSSLPARVAFHGCFRRLEGKPKVAFHTITDFTLLHVLRARLYGLGYPRQPSPRATLAEVTFSLFLSKIQPAVYIRIANSSWGTRQLGWASCLTSAGRVTLASGPGGGGGYLTKFCTGRLRPEVQPLTLPCAILAEKVPLLYTFY